MSHTVRDFIGIEIIFEHFTIAANDLAKTWPGFLKKVSLHSATLEMLSPLALLSVQIFRKPVSLKFRTLSILVAL